MEESIYNLSKIVDGVRMFPDPKNPKGRYEYTEDQLMEAFTFGVAKRHLGVEVATDEDEELMRKTMFRKYMKQS